MRNNRKSSNHKERVIMIASSALVMAALTMTGVYMKNRSSEEENDGYSIDFSELENQADEISGSLGELAQKEEEGGHTLALEDSLGDDLDYDPMSEVDSGRVEIPGLTDREDQDAAGSGSGEKDAGGRKEEAKDQDEAGDRADGARQEDGAQEPAAGSAPAEGAAEGAEENALSDSGAEGEGAEGAPVFNGQNPFTEEQGLARPVAGDVLMHYSMDGSVYFKTLDQYKYNPAVMFSANEGDSVGACSEGTVLSVFQDSEIGQAMTLDLGNGYQATYGQLQNLTVSAGAHVNRGDILGYVAKPTKYYSLEGTNLYFGLTRDGIPVDPEGLF